MSEGLLFDIPPIEMPRVVLGKERPCGGYTETTPREWTDEEIEVLRDLQSRHFSLSVIAECLHRSETSVSIKPKRLSKKKGTYNEDHLGEKYNTNLQFAEMIHPESVLDLYCGMNSWWSKHYDNVTTNDKEREYIADYHEDAEMLIHKLYYEGNSYDLIDLAPFGSAFDCLDLAIKMARKALVVTYGEMGHKRWKRLDYVRRYYGIERLEDFTIQRLIEETLKIGARNKKILTPIEVKNWPRISRVWYAIEPMKITEQWKR